MGCDTQIDKHVISLKDTVLDAKILSIKFTNLSFFNQSVNSINQIYKLLLVSLNLSLYSSHFIQRFYFGYV